MSRESPNAFLTNVNYWFKVAEIIACLVGVLFGRDIDISYRWCVLGWLTVSCALAVAYQTEQPNFGLEFILMSFYLFYMSNSLWDFSVENLAPAIISVIMFIDLVVLVMNRNRE